MSFGRLIFSIALTFHAAAMVVGAVPSLGDFGTEPITPRPAADTARSHLTSLLDQVAVQAVRAHRITIAVLAPVNPLVRAYLDVTEQSTLWNMFSRPGLHNDYVRFDYVFRKPDGERLVESELVFPAGAPGGWRLAGAYFDSFRDKAFAGAAQMYLRRAEQAGQAGLPPPQSSMDDDVRPFLAYYGNHRRQQGRSDMRLERVEYWRGWAPSPAPGEEHSSELVESRLAHLAALSQPRRDSALPGPSCDITWRQWSSLDFPTE